MNNPFALVKEQKNVKSSQLSRKKDCGNILFGKGVIFFAIAYSW